MASEHRVESAWCRSGLSGLSQCAMYVPLCGFAPNPVLDWPAKRVVVTGPYAQIFHYRTGRSFELSIIT
jgi:hypothetical protein